MCSGTVAPGIKQSSAVVIAESSAETRLGPPTTEHSACAARSGRTLRGNWNSIEPGQNPGMQKNIQGVDVIISGLLKVESVFPYLLCCLTIPGSPSRDAATAWPIAGSGKEFPGRTKQELRPKGAYSEKNMWKGKFDVASIQAQGILPLLSHRSREKLGTPAVKRTSKSMTDCGRPPPGYSPNLFLSDTDSALCHCVHCTRISRANLFVAREPVCLGQSDKVLMTVQFPDNLRISDFLEIKIPYPEPWFARRTLTSQDVGVPIDLRTKI